MPDRRSRRTTVWFYRSWRPWPEVISDAIAVVINKCDYSFSWFSP